jgi:hypothetical protein
MPWGAAAAAAATVAGSYISSQANKSAAQTSADAQLEAARLSAEAQKFRPVGISTRFGTSTFEMGPEGYLQSAGYTVSPELIGLQSRLLSSATNAPRAITTRTPQIPAGYSLTPPTPAEGTLGPSYTAVLPKTGFTYAYSPTGERIEVPLTEQTTYEPVSGYTPEQFQESIMPLGTAATGLFNLGGQYLATSPEAAAQQYMEQQRGLLQPGRERALSTIQSRLYGTGRRGLGVQTGTGTAPTSPELQAYYNALAQQEAQLAAQADQYGRERTLFGTQLYGRGAELIGQVPTLISQSYGPMQTQLGLAAEIERLGQQPLDIGAQLGGRSATAGANVGQSLLTGGLGAARTLQAANQYSVPGSLLTGFGSQLSGSAQQNQLGNWFNNLMYGAENVYGGAGRGTVPTTSSGFESWESPYIGAQ